MFIHVKIKVHLSHRNVEICWKLLANELYSRHLVKVKLVIIVSQEEPGQANRPYETQRNPLLPSTFLHPTIFHNFGDLAGPGVQHGTLGSRIQRPTDYTKLRATQLIAFSNSLFWINARNFE